jgi:hypothetical protein
MYRFSSCISVYEFPRAGLYNALGRVKKNRGSTYTEANPGKKPYIYNKS